PAQLSPQQERRCGSRLPALCDRPRRPCPHGLPKAPCARSWPWHAPGRKLHAGSEACLIWIAPPQARAVCDQFRCSQFVASLLGYSYTSRQIDPAQHITEPVGLWQPRRSPGTALLLYFMGEGESEVDGKLHPFVPGTTVVASPWLKHKIINTR